jgi:hypothetical protein
MDNILLCDRPILPDDDETPETTLWRETVERLLASWSSPSEALDGANLILQAYRRQSAIPNPPSANVETTPRTSGVRRRSNSGKHKAK